MSIITKTIEKRWNDLSESAQRQAIKSGRIDPREYWDVYEEGYCYAKITAEDRDDAIQQAIDNVDRNNYPDADGTIWIDVFVRNALTGDEETATVQLDADEPDCVDGHDHDWKAPYSVLGGLKENPGVWGHGGGLIMKKVCAHCGMYQVTDTWAQDRSNGKQGLTSVSYEDADDDSLEWLQSQRDDELMDALSDYSPYLIKSGQFRVAISVPDCDDDGYDDKCDAAIDDLRANLPDGWRAEWSGSGNTDADGDNTEDAIVGWYGP